MTPPFDLVPRLLEGIWITVQVTAGGAAVAFVCAWVAGLGRHSHRRIFKWPAVIYIEVFRGTSALIQLFWFYFVFPFFGVTLSPLACGIIVLGLNIGAYGAEVVRGALAGLPPGQVEAAKALNLTRFQRMRLVVIPQAILSMLPPAGNLLIELMKNTALVSLITLQDLTFIARQMRDDTMRSAEIFGLLLVIYFVLAQVMTKLVRALERYLARGRDARRLA